MNEVESFYNAFRTDPVGAYHEVQSQLEAAGVITTEDPRVAQMYDEWSRQRDLAAYDAEVERIVSDPANSDINASRLALYVAASDGDFDEAVRLYRADAAQIMQDYAALRDDTTPTPRDYRAEGLSPRDALNRAIEDAAAMRRGRR